MATFIGLIFSCLGRILAPSWTVLATSWNPFWNPSWPPAPFLTPTMATFGLFFPSAGSTSVQYLFHKYILCESSESACYGHIYWTHFLVSWPHLGPILDRLGHLCWPILFDLGPSRPHLGAILAHLGSILVPSWPTSAPSWTIVAPSWAHSGPILAPSCPILAYLGPVFVVPRPFPSAAFVLSISVQLPVQLPQHSVLSYLPVRAVPTALP